MAESKSIGRRRFLRQTGSLLIAGTAASFMPLAVLGADQRRYSRLTILHTNDVHSRIEPFPMDGSRWQGLGGAARRAGLIKQIRREQRNVLLLDAGDMVQGTPYFNRFGGELEIQLMNKMGYDAATFGNHEFDNGLEHLAGMVEQAKFPFLNSNYEFGDTPLAGRTNSYRIFNKKGLRVGVFGMGIELSGLVDPLSIQNVQYSYPVAVANEMAGRLKHDLKCDLVICLSHLGYEYRNNKVSDRVLAAETYDIDLIVGGHTHTFMAEPVQIQNKSGGLTVINQVGHSGILLGRIDFIFEESSNKKRLVAAQPYPVGSDGNNLV